MREHTAEFLNILVGGTYSVLQMVSDMYPVRCLNSSHLNQFTDVIIGTH